MDAPVYKVGDKVTIRSSYHEGLNCSDYYLSFTPDMLRKYGGKKATITVADASSRAPGGYIYEIDISEEYCYNWSAYMFKESGDPPELIEKRIQAELAKGWHGKIERFPKDIAEKMLRNQAKVGNKVDISVFERNCLARTRDGGFDWPDSIEGGIFWFDVVTRAEYATAASNIPYTESCITADTVQIVQNSHTVEKFVSKKSKVLFNPIKNIYHGKN